MIHEFAIAACGKEVRFKVELDLTVVTEYALAYYIERKTVPEPEVVQIMAKALRPGDVAVDCGANIGFFTLLMARLVGPSGWVHAFEPEPGNRKALTHHIGLNNLMQVTLCAKALWSTPQKLLFKRSDKDSGESAVVLEGNEGCVSVWATTLDHEIPLNTSPRLIKLDVEGSELRALEGATKLLEKHQPYVIAEMNESNLNKLNCTQGDLRAFMRGLGYETFLLHPHFVVPVLLPPKTRLMTDRANINVMFCSMDQFSELWPEVGA